MPRKLERRACFPCTEAKRKCNRQVPECQRCSSKDMACRYPGPRILYEVAYNKEGQPLTTRVSAGPLTSNPQSALPAAVPMGISCSRQMLSNSKSDAALQSPWFLSLPSWSLRDAVCETGTGTFSGPTALRYVGKLRSWLLQWTTTGHCPMFHGLCRSAVMPPYVEEAYTMLVAYQNRSEKTSHTVLHIVERAVTRLLQKEQCEGLDDDTDIPGQQAVAVAAHLERTQALLIYEIIRLFDGDIRSRAQAEEGLHVLSIWTRQMWQRAASAAASSAADTFHGGQRPQQGNAAEPVPPSAFAPPLEPTFAAQRGDADSTWKAWIFAESIRRTYLTSIIVEAVYTVLKQGWAYCSPGIAYSGGCGLWDATSSTAWLDQIRRNDVFAIHSVELDRLFAEATPSDVDDFTQVALAVSYGLERYEAWDGVSRET